MNEVLTYEALKADRDAQQKRADALAVENAEMRETLHHIIDSSNIPEYHHEGMGCGLEDRGITDPYEAMHHGWECAIGRVYSDVIPDMPETPVTSAALAAIEVRGVEKALAIVEACRGSVCAGGLSENRQYEESIVHPHLDGISDELEALAIELREAK